MSRLTICPHYLLDYPQSSPEDIEKNIIKPLYNCIKKAIDRNVVIVIAREILEYFTISYPWNLSQDPQWRGYILDWYTLITQNITNKCEILSAVQGCPDTNHVACNKLSSKINKLFIDFLNIFSSKDMPGGESEEGIIASSSCKNSLAFSGCYLLLEPKDINYVIYPWLRFYKKPLPPTGDFPFIPPENWKCHTAPAKGSGHGFLDANGIEWKWDMLHQNHWDVQDGSPYKNVTTDGRVL